MRERKERERSERERREKKVEGERTGKKNQEVIEEKKKLKNSF